MLLFLNLFYFVQLLLSSCFWCKIRELAYQHQFMPSEKCEKNQLPDAIPARFACMYLNAIAQESIFM